MLSRGGTGARPSRRCFPECGGWMGTLGVVARGHAACSALEKGIWQPPPSSPGCNIWGGNETEWDFPLLSAWWKWARMEVSPPGRIWRLGAVKAAGSIPSPVAGSRCHGHGQPLLPSTSPTPYTREQTLCRLLEAYPGVSHPRTAQQITPGKAEECFAVSPWSPSAFRLSHHRKKAISNRCSGAGRISHPLYTWCLTLFTSGARQ